MSNRSCYKADLLSDTEFISDTRCDLPCPGDPTLICGGNFRGRQKLLHRAIAPDHLLTLYRKTVSSFSSSSSASYASSSYTPPSSSLQATGAHTYVATSQSSSLSRYNQTTSSYSLSSFTTINLGTKTLSVSDSTITKTTSESRLPTPFPTPTAIHTAYSIVTIDHAYTKTQFAETVTTVTYTTINPSNPAALNTTCVPITLLYSPCECEHQVHPSVDMTTVSCSQGGQIVTLTVPRAAYETSYESYTHPIVQYSPGWVGGYQTDAGGNSYPVLQPTGGSQGGYQPGSVNSQSETLTRATGLRDDSRPSYMTHQPATPTSAAESKGDTHPGQGNTQPPVSAQGAPESNSNTLMNPSPSSSLESLTTETSIPPTPQHETSAIPSQSSPPHHGQVPSEPKEAPYATPMVVSDAHSYELSSWITMGAIVGLVLLL
ncbi:Acriflavine sensitivity control protein acr-2 [Fusarium oxysporum f. sp. albedinis]|nr:Acriflavine sensitivity control protein acr-2 [Fusarium oxysporum f. sp. albedinis]